jgi:polyisoprenoid-binding protein YceI
MTEWLKGLLAAVLAAAAGPSPADSNSWQSTDTESDLQFETRYEEQALNGRFNSFSVIVTLDGNDEFPVALKVLVDVASADMNDRDVNSELEQPAWFDSIAFPQAIFESDELVRVDSESYIARGALSLKGVSRDLEVPLAWRRNSATATIAGSMDLSRLAWNIGSGEWAETDVISDTVKLTYRITLLPAD